MNKLFLVAAAAALVTSMPLTTFASGKSIEDKCKAEAEKHQIAAGKMDAYVKSCVDKHTKAEAAPAAPAQSATPATTNKPGM